MKLKHIINELNGTHKFDLHDISNNMWYNAGTFKNSAFVVISIYKNNDMDKTFTVGAHDLEMQDDLQNMKLNIFHKESASNALKIIDKYAQSIGLVHGLRSNINDIRKSIGR